MADLPLHPALVHLPLGIALVLPVVVVAVLVGWHRGLVPRRAWWLAVGLQAALVVSALLAVRTGGEDEERVEAVVPEAAIHEHEELAEAFAWSGGALLVVMVVAGVLRRERLGLGLGVASAAGSLALLGLGLAVGHAGGELVYRHGAASAYTGAPSTPHPEEEEDDD